MSDKYPEDWDRLRRIIYDRDNYQCCNCGITGTELHCHHIVPIEKGGTHKKSNLVTLCEQCHKSIHNNEPVARTHEEYEQDPRNLGFMI